MTAHTCSLCKTVYIVMKGLTQYVTK